MKYKLWIIAIIGFVIVSCDSDTTTCMHNWQWLETIASDCETIEVETKTCSLCHVTDGTRQKEALGHNWQWLETIASDCETIGVETKTCSFCHVTDCTRQKEVLGHNWNEWKESITPTEIETGEIEKVCANNSTHTETLIIPKFSAFYGTWLAENISEGSIIYDSTLRISNNTLMFDDSDGEYYYFVINNWIAIANSSTTTKTVYPSGYKLTGDMLDKSDGYINRDSIHIYMHTNGQILLHTTFNESLFFKQ